MEEHRLQPMVENYDEKLFNKLYDKTKILRQKLAYEINPHKFKVDTQEIKSWFDIKFIYTFNKYCNQKNEGELLGCIINSLRHFKYRIIRNGYQKKYSHEFQNDVIDLTRKEELQNIIAMEGELPMKEIYMKLAVKFMKENLSDDAMLILELELNPPQYIVNKLDETGRDEDQRIPSNIIADYLNLGDSRRSVNLINSLREEIRNSIVKAREYFSGNNHLLIPIN